LRAPLCACGPKRFLSQIEDHPSKKKRPERPRLFDAKTYGTVRSSVERFNARIGSFRRVATRYKRLPTLHTGSVHLGCIAVHLRVLQ
jgi:transposase